MDIKLIDLKIEPIEKTVSPLEVKDRDQQTDPSLNYIYLNTQTGTYVEFSLFGVEEGIDTDEAIEYFLQRVNDYDKDPSSLPDTLLKQLQENELDIFMLAPYSKKTQEALSNMIFIQKENEYYVDAFGFVYNVEMIGKKHLFLSYTPPGGDMIVIYVDKEMLEKPGAVLKNVGVSEE